MSVSLLPGDAREAQGMRVALQLSLKTRVCRHTCYICIRTAEVAVNVSLTGLQRSDGLCFSETICWLNVCLCYCQWFTKENKDSLLNIHIVSDKTHQSNIACNLSRTVCAINMTTKHATWNWNDIFDVARFSMENLVFHLFVLTDIIWLLNPEVHMILFVLLWILSWKICASDDIFSLYLHENDVCWNDKMCRALHGNGCGLLAINGCWR